ncbi:TetR/AcrR family transcriptional regulator [Sesbania bispinosa]|nr:TetR/AcrR family transcriptional regulator [Sesbania bispinosa]
MAKLARILANNLDLLREKMMSSNYNCGNSIMMEDRAISEDLHIWNGIVQACPKINMRLLVDPW